MYYKNSPEIVTFFNKAQNKIADIATLMVSRKNLDDLGLALQMLNFLESLDNEWCPWTEDRITQMMEYYNSAADLNNIPFLEIVGYKTNVLFGDGSSRGDLYTSDIIDYLPTTKALLAAMKHNSLQEIQGGKPGEYYHFTKDQWEKLLKLISKEPTVGIRLISAIPAPTNGVWEKGIPITQYRVQGSVVLNDGGVHYESRYLLNNALTHTFVENAVLQVAEYNGSIVSTPTIKFQAFFTAATMKEAQLQLVFELPYFWAIDIAGRSMGQLKLSKGLKARGNTSINYIIDPPNATADVPVYPYVLFPSEWGRVKSIGEAASSFDYITSFKFRGVVVRTLADGTSVNYDMYEYVTATQGNMTFTFRF